MNTTINVTNTTAAAPVVVDIKGNAGDSGGGDAQYWWAYPLAIGVACVILLCAAVYCKNDVRDKALNLPTGGRMTV